MSKLPKLKRKRGRPLDPARREHKLSLRVSGDMMRRVMYERAEPMGMKFPEYVRNLIDRDLALSHTEHQWHARTRNLEERVQRLEQLLEAMRGDEGDTEQATGT